MARQKGGGKDDAEKGTHQIRVNADLGEMIAWIVRIEEVKTAQLLDPMLRAQIIARYKKHETAIERLKAADESLRKIEEEVKEKARADQGAAPARKKRE